jgi:hypothetical protein
VVAGAEVKIPPRSSRYDLLQLICCPTDGENH